MYKFLFRKTNLLSVNLFCIEKQNLEAEQIIIHQKKSARGASSYKFHGVQFLAWRCIIHGNSRALTPAIIHPCRCYRRCCGRRSQVCVQRKILRRCIDWEQGRIGVRRSVATWLDESRRRAGQRKTATVIVRADARPCFLQALSWLLQIISCARVTKKMIYRKYKH